MTDDVQSQRSNQTSVSFMTLITVSMDDDGGKDGNSVSFSGSVIDEERAEYNVNQVDLKQIRKEISYDKQRQKWQDLILQLKRTSKNRATLIEQQDSHKSHRKVDK